MANLKICLLLFSWNGDIHSTSLRFYVLKASSLPQSQWRLLLRHRLVLVITQRLVLIFDPFLFFWNSTPLTSICRAALTKPGKSNLRNKCSEKQICRFSFIFPFTCSSHPWPWPVLLEHRNTHPNACKAFVSHGKCVGLESQCSDLFSTHEGGVYSISMVIKPDWKACRHTCVFVCVNVYPTHTLMEGWGLAPPPFILLRWKGVVLIICCMHMHKPAHTVHTQGNFFFAYAVISTYSIPAHKSALYQFF